MQVHHFVIYTVAWCDRGLSKIEMYRNSIFFLVLKGGDLDGFLLLHLLSIICDRLYLVLTIQYLLGHFRFCRLQA